MATQYITSAELVQLSISSAAISGIAGATVTKAIEAASAMADGYFSTQYKLPLIAPFPDDLKQTVAAITAWLLIKTRGFNPESPSDNAILEDKRAAMKWLKDISDQRVTPQVTDSQTGGTYDNQLGPFVVTPAEDPDDDPVSPSRRGW